MDVTVNEPSALCVALAAVQLNFNRLPESESCSFRLLFISFLSFQGMADYIAYVAKDLYSVRGEGHLNWYYDESCFCWSLLQTFPTATSLPPPSLCQHVTSWSVSQAGPARLSAASVRPSRVVFAKFSATHHRSSPPTPGRPRA